MSANGATNERLGFHRWVASLKREASSAGGHNAPLSAPPPAESTAPPSPHKVSSAPAPRVKRDDDATRVHHIPKEIIHRMRARAASEAPKAPQDERTCVFRAPPELLERAKRAGDTSDAPPSDVLASPSAGLHGENFGETLEAKSGVSLRLQGPPSIQPLEPPHDEEPQVVEELQVVEEPVDDERTAIRVPPSVDAPLQSHFDAAALANEAPLDPLSEASIERLSEAPSFRPPLVGKLWVAALLVVVVLLQVWWSTR
jgi:hypothetical protein